MQNSKKPKQTANLLIIAILVVVAAGLLIASRFIQSPNANLSQTEIQDTIKALATETPKPLPTETVQAVEAETTEAPVARYEELAKGYLFIILEDRIWGIEPLGEEHDVTVDQGNGVVNVIHLQKDGFYMQSSTCDNQLCVSEGTVTLTNWQERILGPCVYCLPHNLQLELVVPNPQPTEASAPDAWTR
ncbi:MAG: hypothetical protein IKH30_13370 [Clostridia bacterium]|nr:hypothetical protein [Clostridia bacterium]